MTLEEAYRQAVQEQQERAGQGGLNGLQGIPNDIDVNRMPGPPAIQPSDRILADQGYQMQPDPNNMTNPPARQMADQAQPLDEAKLGDLAGWYNDPSDGKGGLGLAGPGPLPDRPETLDEHFARRIFPGFKGELSFGDKLRLRDGMMNAIPSMAAQRQTTAQQQAELEEKKRQHDIGFFEKAMGDPRKLEALSQMPGYSMAGQAKMMVKTMKDADYKSFPKYQKTIERIQPGSTEKFLKGEMDYYEFNGLIDIARTSEKENAHAQAKNLALEDAMRTPKDQRTPFQESLVNDKDLAQRKVESEIYKNFAQGEKSEQGPPDRTEINRVSLAETGKPFDALPPGGPEQKRVIQAHAERYALGKTNVLMGTPAPTKDRVNFVDRTEFLKHDKIVNPPPGTSEGAIRTGSYVEMTDRQRDDWGNLVNSGATLQTLFDEIEPLIVADTPMKAAKQFARLHLEAVTKKNPAAATYLADSEAFSSRMARVFGSEVGVLTNPDVTRWQRALPTFGDTKQVMAEKKRIFTGIYKQTKEMYKKKIAGEDISEDLVGMRRGLLKEADKLGIASMATDDQFNLLMGK